MKCSDNFAFILPEKEFTVMRVFIIITRQTSLAVGVICGGDGQGGQLVDGRKEEDEGLNNIINRCT